MENIKLTILFIIVNCRLFVSSQYSRIKILWLKSVGLTDNTFKFHYINTRKSVQFSSYSILWKYLISKSQYSDYIFLKLWKELYSWHWKILEMWSGAMHCLPGLEWHQQDAPVSGQLCDSAFPIMYFMKMLRCLEWIVLRCLNVLNSYMKHSGIFPQAHCSGSCSTAAHRPSTHLSFQLPQPWSGSGRNDPAYQAALPEVSAATKGT